ncbi:hypothetical protein [Streptomyces melanogenes]|uniref:hypothetical protein n=1 Tax=Streptomyces melanogenes TaxID=67326 RepID=UPI00167DD4C5|nr:hypothetical protein [Streptomyces melanogenes]GGP79968.1 hypothetical protein GCM10010278_67930 [Streptomyces melanogenes]
MIRDAATCDRPDCLAVLLEPDHYSGAFEEAVTAYGWTVGPGGHTCPACQSGRGPVLERGECARCGGRVGVRHGTELCMACGQLTPANGPEWDETPELDDDLMLP